ncbi:MAG: S-layer homology domain-containing protein [Oscillospiraceae bacterium]|nr:S-layer homology domain-containing protein [Oscillospiraceae bacterium]
MINLPDGYDFDLPEGESPVIDSDGTVNLPGGATVTTPNGTKIVLPAGTAISPEGKISFPAGSGAKITQNNGYAFEINENAQIVLDSDSPLGYTVIIENPFEDVHESDWFFDPVMFAYSRGLMVGTSAVPMLFDPNAATTRAMIVTILYRMEGSPDITGLDNPFDDVASGTWYHDAIVWAAANGIVNGYGDGQYGPQDDITREQLAAIMNNYIGHIGSEFPKIREYAGFGDENEISGYAREAIERLFAAGIINGRTGNIFDPRGKATRAEMATMLKNLIEAQA